MKDPATDPASGSAHDPWSEARGLCEAAWRERSLLSRSEVRVAVEAVVAALDRGALRVATPPAIPSGAWTVHPWIKQAILLYFAMNDAVPSEAGPFHYRDKIPLKSEAPPGVRIVPRRPCAMAHTSNPAWWPCRAT